MRIKTVTLALVTIVAGALTLAQAQAQAKVGVVNVARLLLHRPHALEFDQLRGPPHRLGVVAGVE